MLIKNNAPYWNMACWRVLIIVAFCFFFLYLGNHILPMPQYDRLQFVLDSCSTDSDLSTDWDFGVNVQF